MAYGIGKTIKIASKSPKVLGFVERVADRIGGKMGRKVIKVEVVENKLLPQCTKPNLTEHAIERMAERGITKKMIEAALEHGEKFYDPLNQSYNYILKNSFASGNNLLIGVSISSGKVKTVLSGSKKLIKKRMIPIK